MMFPVVPLASAIGIMVMPYVHLLAEWEASKADTPQRKHKGTQIRSLRVNDRAYSLHNMLRSMAVSSIASSPTTCCWQRVGLMKKLRATRARGSAILAP